MTITRHLACVVGARPNFMKMAPILRALQAYPRVRATLVHTGQHYDTNLSDVFFDELAMPRPDVSLEVGSGKHGAQTARILERFEAALEAGPAPGGKFDRVVVVGDVNSTMACALAAVKLGVPVAHVEAGLRSFDRAMPEEINRVVTDAISDCLLVSEEAGVRNLRSESKPVEQIHLVGNAMIDTLFHLLPKARSLNVLAEHGLTPGDYGLVTLHRPSNVDSREALSSLMETLACLGRKLPLVFVAHPRTVQRLRDFGLDALLGGNRQLRVLPSLGYLAFLSLSSQARLVITDSGGLQEETTALGIPCLTMRGNTERPVTVERGTSTLVGDDPCLLEQCFDQILSGRYKAGVCPALWDGHAAERIAKVLAET